MTPCGDALTNLLHTVACRRPGAQGGWADGGGIDPFARSSSEFRKHIMRRGWPSPLHGVALRVQHRGAAAAAQGPTATGGRGHLHRQRLLPVPRRLGGPAGAAARLPRAAVPAQGDGASPGVGEETGASPAVASHSRTAPPSWATLIPPSCAAWTTRALWCALARPPRSRPSPLTLASPGAQRLRRPRGGQPGRAGGGI